MTTSESDDAKPCAMIERKQHAEGLQPRHLRPGRAALLCPLRSPPGRDRAHCPRARVLDVATCLSPNLTTETPRHRVFFYFSPCPRDSVAAFILARRMSCRIRFG